VADIVALRQRMAAQPTPVRLAEIRAAGLVRRASEHAEPAGVERSLPLAPALCPLFPGGALRRGSTVALAPVNPGTTSLLFAVLAAASAAGSWCAAVGLPDLGLVAAAEAGVVVDRLALVPQPGPEWPGVVAALLDGVDIVVLAPPGTVAPAVVSRLAARARQRGAVLIPMGSGGWSGAELTLEVVASAWHGLGHDLGHGDLGHGRGRLGRHEVEVLARGRGAAARPRRAHLWLPTPTEGAMGAAVERPADVVALDLAG
jgi:hypothetical protein